MLGARGSECTELNSERYWNHQQVWRWHRESNPLFLSSLLVFQRDFSTNHQPSPTPWHELPVPTQQPRCLHRAARPAEPILLQCNFSYSARLLQRCSSRQFSRRTPHGGDTPTPQLLSVWQRFGECFNATDASGQLTFYLALSFPFDKLTVFLYGFLWNLHLNSSVQKPFLAPPDTHRCQKRDSSWMLQVGHNERLQQLANRTAPARLLRANTMQEAYREKRWWGGFASFFPHIMVKVTALSFYLWRNEHFHVSYWAIYKQHSRQWRPEQKEKNYTPTLK